MTDARENLLRDLLKKIVVEQKYDNPEIEITVVPTTGANFTSQLFHATIRSKGKKDLNVFAKVAVIGESMHEKAGLNMFDVEKHFYTHLARTYKEIEDKHDIPDEHRLVVPKFYGYSSDYLKEVLVLQDMSKEGFITYNRLESVDWDYASKAIKEMAKLHALSIAFIKEYPDDYEETTKVFKNKFFEECGPLVDMYKQSIQQVIYLAREENRLRLQKFLDKTFDHQSFVKFFQPKKIPVIMHSDFRQSNLMHQIGEDGQLQIVIVDYQTLHTGNVATDLLYFIFTGSDGKFRAQYYDQLIEHYYDNLAAALRRLNLDPEVAFPRTDFDKELKEMMPLGLVMACMVLPMITVDLARVNEMDGADLKERNFETITGLLGSPGNALCSQRLNEVIDDYVKWGIL